MKVLPRRFPTHRRRNPKRWAEAGVFDALAQSHRPGAAIYEWGAPVNPHQLDFALWLTDVGRFAIEVKGGRYTLDLRRDCWLLHSKGGAEAKPSPVAQVKAAARDLRREIRRQTGRRVRIIPVVVFTNMMPDPGIEGQAQRDGVQVIWGAAHLVEALEVLAQRLEAPRPPGPGQVRSEVRAVTVGNPRPDHGPSRESVSAEPSVGHEAVADTRITIGRVRRLIIQPKLEVLHNSNSGQAHPYEEVS